MQKLSESDDIENYLTTFERVATAFKWPTEIWSLTLALYLTGKAQVAFETMDKDQTHCYESVKTAILKRYNINEETYRQRFRAARKELQESYVELEVRFRDAFDKWTKPKERTSKELADFTVMEQLIEDMPPETQLRIRERKPKTSREAGELADDYYLDYYAFWITWGSSHFPAYDGSGTPW